MPMSRADAVTCLYELSKAFPKEMTKERVAVYCDELRKFDKGQLMRACIALRAKARFMPAIPDIIEEIHNHTPESHIEYKAIPARTYLDNERVTLEDNPEAQRRVMEVLRDAGGATMSELVTGLKLGWGDIGPALGHLATRGDVRYTNERRQTDIPINSDNPDGWVVWIVQDGKFNGEAAPVTQTGTDLPF